jgi:hypothetical protein
MDLSLRLVAVHPNGGSKGGTATEFALSSRKPAILLGQGRLLVEQSTSTLAVRASLRTAADIERLVYCGGPATYLAFLENREIAAYVEQREGGVELASTVKLPGDQRSISCAAGSRTGSFAVFTKDDSPSVYHVKVDADGKLHPEDSATKLRGDIMGDQTRISTMDSGLAKLKGKVTTNAKSRPCPVVALDAHPSKHFAAAAYANGILRVWDVNRKELQSQFDAQLLLREVIVDIALHPHVNALLACTSKGRVMAFQIKNAPFGKAEQPQLATFKLRDGARRFCAMAFMEGSPHYLLLLTTTRRIVVRLVTSALHIVASTRYFKPSRALATELDGAGSPSSFTLDPNDRAPLLCDSQFGLVASSFDKSGNVLVYQTMDEQFSGVRRAVVGAPLDTPFSMVPGKAFKGPIDMYKEGLFAQHGKLFSFALESMQVTQLCHLPRSSEVRRIEVARDQYGDLLAAIIFLHVDGEEDANAMYKIETTTSQYVIANRRDGEAWNVSTPVEGATGCFLNASGRHDRFLILSADGKTVSVRSFAGQRLTSDEKQNPQMAGGRLGVSAVSRGVQRFRIGGQGVSQVFRAPFSSWYAVVYEDTVNHRLAVSNNSFRITPAFADIASEGEAADDVFGMDEETVMQLNGKERVIDIRWQRLPTGSRDRRGEQYLGAIMTNKRVYIVRDVFERLTIFEFSTLDRNIVPFTMPTMCWVGPAVVVMFGQYMYAVTLDGEADFLAGMSRGDNACALLAAMPDGVVLVRPAPPPATASSASASLYASHLSVSVVSRPIGMMSVLVRGMLALPSARSNDGSYYIGKLKDILLSHDSSQGSEMLFDALIRNNLAPIAYILIRSATGKHSLPPLKRAANLGRIGDLRGALAAAEAEYSRLPSADAFHDGTELFRLLQRILNMAMSSGDFAVGRRCSELLGRKGTFSAFVDGEGGFAALTSLSKYAKESRKPGIAQALGTLLEKSSKSCIANDSTGFPSAEQMQQTRAGIQAYSRNAFDLGTRDLTEVRLTVAPREEGNLTFGNPQTVQLPPLAPARFIERLEMKHRDECIVLKGQFDMDGDSVFDIDADMSLAAGTGHKLLQGPGVSNVEGGGANVAVGPLLLPDPATTHPLSGGNFDSVPPQDIGDIRKDADEYGVALRDTAADVQDRMQGIGVATQQAVGGPRAMLDSRELQLASAHFGDAVRAEAGHQPDQLALRRLNTAFLKMRNRRNASALREVQHGLKGLGRAIANEELVVTPERRVIVCELVCYLVALKILNAIDAIVEAPQGSSLPGKLTIAQFATALTLLPLRVEDKRMALMLAVDANMAINSFGRAAEGMGILKNLGVPQEIRGELRAKYAICTTRGLMDATPPPNTQLCWHTLRLITPGVQELTCNFCPASFSVPGLTDDGVRLNHRCVCCHIGRMMLR